MSRNAPANSSGDCTIDLIPTPVGTAGITWYPGPRHSQSELALSCRRQESIPQADRADRE